MQGQVEMIMASNANRQKILLQCRKLFINLWWWYWGTGEKSSLRWNFFLLVLLKSWDIIQRYFCAQHRRHDIPWKNETMLLWTEKVFSSAFEVTLKFCFAHLSAKPRKCGLDPVSTWCAHIMFFHCQESRAVWSSQGTSAGSSLNDWATHGQDFALWWERFALVWKLGKMNQDRFPAVNFSYNCPFQDWTENYNQKIKLRGMFYRCVLGLHGQVLVAGELQRWLLWETVRNFLHILWCQCQPAPKWTRSKLSQSGIVVTPLW